jgi:hypothetical protein
LELGEEMHSRNELSMALSKVGWYKNNNFHSKEKMYKIYIYIYIHPHSVIGSCHSLMALLNQNTRKMCLESCTSILGPTGGAQSTFQNYLFSVELMCLYVTHSKTTVVICELEDDCTDGYGSSRFTVSQPPLLTIQQLFQSEQMGNGIWGLLQMDQMGYGFTATNGWSAPL